MVAVTEELFPEDMSPIRDCDRINIQFQKDSKQKSQNMRKNSDDMSSFILRAVDKLMKEEGGSGIR